MSIIARFQENKKLTECGQLSCKIVLIVQQMPYCKWVSCKQVPCGNRDNRSTLLEPHASPPAC